MKTLFLHPPSFDGFDGGAGVSRLLDAPADGLGLGAVSPLAHEYDLVILHMSSPSFPTDAHVLADGQVPHRHCG
ncbi:MAG TPA: hypothetical protein VN730_03140 [Steroidobacteraceae bacterium]|nr:hypothetical protein [Steroidobacteraceae bacterium]